MLSRTILFTLLLSSNFINLASAKQQALYNFTEPNTVVKLSAQGAQLVDSLTEKNQQGEHLRRLTFLDNIDNPHLTLSITKDHQNLSTSKAISLRIQNAMDWDLTLYINIKDTAGNSLHAIVALPAGPAQTLLIPLKETSSRAWGMRTGLTSPWLANNERYLLPISVEGKVNTKNIASITLAMDKPAANQHILLADIATTNDDVEHNAYFHLVDQYGQNNHGQWPEKITNDQQLKTTIATESKQLALWQKAAIKQDKYGRIGDKPLFKATQFFRTEQYKGRWYLVTPAGYPFISLGVNTVDPNNSQTYLTKRDFMFISLPNKQSSLAAFYGYDNTSSGNAAQGGRGVDQGTWYNFYQANLYRIDPIHTVQAWQDRTINRLKAWGFNTLGNWSDKDLIKQKRLPYTLPILIKGDYSAVPSGTDWWGYMPDPFDPKFNKAVEQAVTIATHGHQTDPWLIGYFADNELSWGGFGDSASAHYALAINTLKLTKNSPAKQALLKLLQTKYKTSDKLATAWGIKLTQWQQLEQQDFQAPLPNDSHPAISEDYSHFLKLYADAYFKTVKDTLLRHDSNHLLLGSRFATKTPEAISSCAQYCDVISFNLYTTLPQDGYDTKLIKQLNKPIMISEFSFGSKDNGALWAGPVEVANEQARAIAYQHFVIAAFNDPHMVGVHWFQYIDEPVTGRLLDGENGHLGLVSIVDRPFQVFIDKARETNLMLLKNILNKPLTK